MEYRHRVPHDVGQNDNEMADENAQHTGHTADLAVDLQQNKGEGHTGHIHGRGVVVQQGVLAQKLYRQTDRAAVTPSRISAAVARIPIFRLFTRPSIKWVEEPKILAYHFRGEALGREGDEGCGREGGDDDHHQRRQQEQHHQNGKRSGRADSHLFRAYHFPPPIRFIYPEVHSTTAICTSRITASRI